MRREVGLVREGFLGNVDRGELSREHRWKFPWVVTAEASPGGVCGGGLIQVSVRARGVGRTLPWQLVLGGGSQRTLGRWPLIKACQAALLPC